MSTVSNMILNNNKSKLTSFGARLDPPLWGYHSSVCQQREEKSRGKPNLSQIKDSGPRMVFLREKTPLKDLLWTPRGSQGGRMGQDDLFPVQQIIV